MSGLIRSYRERITYLRFVVANFRSLGIEPNSLIREIGKCYNEINQLNQKYFFTERV